jgi:hypothetical protein
LRAVAVVDVPVDDHHFANAVLSLRIASDGRFPFLSFGANALLAYMISEVYDRTISDVLVINLAKQWGDPYGELLRSITEIGLLWILLWYLYCKRTFVRA